MDALQNNILDISHNHYEYLMNLENVNGVGLGFKRIKGQFSKEPCIHVLVENKVNENYLTSNNIIPKKYMGIKTDVIEVGKILASSGEAIPQKLRPLESGCGISLDGNNEDGTLGCIVTKIVDGEMQYFILSNNHVLADLNNAPIGSPIVQPSFYITKEENENIIAHLDTFIPLKFDSRSINYVDCAIGKILDNSNISNKIFELGEIAGYNKPTLDLYVKKVGFVSGLSEGKIVSIGVTQEIFYSAFEIAKFKDQIYTDAKSTKGDSGSAILNQNNEIVGILLGTSNNDDYTIFNDINLVLDALKVDIYIE